jgi:hypothetical protein
MRLALLGLLMAFIRAVPWLSHPKHHSEWDANLPGGYRMFDDR